MQISYALIVWKCNEIQIFLFMGNCFVFMLKIEESYYNILKNSTTCMSEQLAQPIKKVMICHSILAIVMLVLLIPSCIVLNRPWSGFYDNPHQFQYDLFSSIQQFLKIEVQALTQQLYLLQSLYFSLQQANNQYQLYNQSPLRCYSKNITCLQYETDQEKFIDKLYTTSSFMQCLTNDCSGILSLGSRIFWLQYINRMTIIDQIYMREVQINNDTIVQQKLIVIPIIGNVTSEIKNLSNLNETASNIWKLSQISNQLFASKKILINNTMFIEIYARINENLFEQKTQMFIQYLAPQSQIQIVDQSSLLFFEFSKLELSDPIYTTQSIIHPLNQNLQILNKGTYFNFTFTQGKEKTSSLQMHDALDIFIIIPFIFGVFVFLLQYNTIKSWVQYNFRQILRIQRLFTFNINEIFRGRKPVNTLVLESGNMFHFYEKISQIPDTNLFGPVCQTPKKIQKKQPFKFERNVRSIVEKFRTECQPILQEKRKQIINNKFFIHSFINQTCEGQSKQLKAYFVKAKQLGLTKQFFKFAYLSLLKSPEVYDKIIQSDKTPLPQDSIICFFRKINRIIKSSEIKKAFKFHHKVSRQTEEQMQIRVQGNLLLKYLLILKDLDVHNEYAKILQLQQDLWILNENAENQRYLLGKHNKNIRSFNK